MRFFRFFPTIFLLIGCLLVFLLVGPANQQAASAQCSKPSSCKTCHETQGFKPVNQQGDWHVQHAMFDFCADCHAGDRLAADQPAAHQGIMTGLNDIQASCQNCHTNNWREKLDIYAAAAGISLGPITAAVSTAQPTPDPIGVFLGQNPVGVGPAATKSPSPGSSAPEPLAPNTTGNLILGSLSAVVALGGGSYVVLNERRKRARQPRERLFTTPVLSIPGYSDQVAGLLPRIAALDPETVDALDCLLDDPASANVYLPRLADLLDTDLIDQVNQLDGASRALLFALSGKAKHNQ